LITPEQSWLMTRVHAPGGNLGHFLFWVLVVLNNGHPIAARGIVTKIFPA